MTTTCDIRKTTISDLPSEILSHIFSYLPNHIRVIRLVCSKWNESCNTEKVSGSETIVIRLWVDEFLSNTTLHAALLRDIYNLRLEFIYFRPHYVSFFQKLGGKLRSLTLKRCNAAEYMPFLLFCKNLNALILDDCSPTIVQSFRCLDGSFIKTNIISLKILNCSKWVDETMDGCFRTCPHLRSFTIEKIPLKFFPRADKIRYSFKDDEERVFNRSDIFSFSCIHHAFSIRAASIVELNLKCRYILPEQIEQIASIPNLKLRTFKLTGNDGITQRSICNFVTLQRDLQNIGICWCEQIPINESADWIERCSKLTRLKIRTAYREPFVFDEKLLNALTSRVHLRKLVLITDKGSVVRSDFENNRGTFNHLRTLKLSFPTIEYDCILEKVSVNLNHLYLNGKNKISSQTLELISNRFTNLETLELKIGDRAMSVFYEERSSEQISLGNLEKLKTLEIWVHTEERCLTRFLRRFKPPNLRFLKLDVGVIDATSLCEIVKNHPSVEFFQLLCNRCKMDRSYLRIMSDWKSLNFFYLGGSTPVEYLELHRRRENEDKFESLLKSLEKKSYLFLEDVLAREAYFEFLNSPEYEKERILIQARKKIRK